MPILIDLSQIAISNLMMAPKSKQQEYAEDDLMKHMIYNSIRAYNVKFKNEYGPIVICCDSYENWRKTIFPEYKANRKKSRDSSDFDWKAVFKTINTIKSDLREHFPYKVIEVLGAEGDDVIAVIAKNATTPTLIIGSDKDYAQLHLYPHVKQYSPKKKAYIKIPDPQLQLNELIITGDKGDGIPNIKTVSNAIAIGKRQTSIRKNDLARWVKQEPKMFCENKTMLEYWNRNKTLIDFSCIPTDIQESILNEYAKEPNGSKMKVMTYFSTNRMRNLLRDVDQF